MTHNIERTSPKGEKFIGKCFTCGQEGLTSSDALKDCPNTANLTNEQALLKAINGPNQLNPDPSQGR